MNKHFNLFSENLTEKRFRFYIIWFRVAGIPMFDKVPKLFKMYSIIATFLAYMVNISLYVEIFVHNEDLEHTVDTTRMASSTTITIWLFSFLRFRPSQVMKLMRLTESFDWETLPKRDVETGILTMTGWIDVVKSIIRKLMACSLSFLFPYVIISSLMSGEKRLIYNTWLPYDASSSPVYEFTLLMQMAVSVIYASSLFSFFGMYVTLVCIACSELEHLKIALLQNRDTCPLTNDEPNANTEWIEQDLLYSTGVTSMYENITKCIQHHQKFLSFIRAMEDTLNPVMAGVFLLCLINCCLCPFSIVTSLGNFPQMVIGLVIYMVTLILVGICCYFGYELSCQAESVRAAAYGCDWIGRPIAVQQSISLIIEMTNKEITLTAGKFVPVTISTMVNMINQSMSYFMFLLEVKTSLENTELPATD